MRGYIVILALAALVAGTGCIVDRGVVRDEPVVTAPPPPPADTGTSYQAEAPPPPAGSEIADQDVFYGALEPYGSWTYVAPYGQVWVPWVGFGWRPYYYGRWVLTDWGWTFASDDPWGWAAYHYGRWNWGIGLGWYWIPGTVWAPAWVSWRFGGGYAAWCPLGPPGVYFGYHHPGWVAVRNEHFTQPIRGAALPAQMTQTVVPRATQPLSGARAQPVRGGSFGPPVSAVQGAVGRPIARVPVSQVVGRPQAGRAAPARAANDPLRSPSVQPRPRVGSGGDVARPGAGQPGVTRPRPYGQPGTTRRPSGEARPAPRPYGGNAPGAPSGGATSPRPRGGGEGVAPGGGYRRPGDGGGGYRPGDGGGGYRPGGGGGPRPAPSAPAPAPAPAPSAPKGRSGGGPHAHGSTRSR